MRRQKSQESYLPNIRPCQQKSYAQEWHDKELDQPFSECKLVAAARFLRPV